MSGVINYFDDFNNHILYHTKNVLRQFDNENDYNGFTRSILFKEVMTYDEVFNKPLYDFISWLISNNEPEIFFSKQCNIRLIHHEGDLYQLQITLREDSKCLITETNVEWIYKSIAKWKKYNKKILNKAEVTKSESMIQDLKMLYPHVFESISPNNNTDFSGAKMELLKRLKLKEKELEQINNDCLNNTSLSRNNIEIIEQILAINDVVPENEIKLIEKIRFASQQQADLNLITDFSSIESDIKKLGEFCDHFLNGQEIDSSSLNQLDMDSQQQQLDIEKKLNDCKNVIVSSLQVKNVHINEMLMNVANDSDALCLNIIQNCQTVNNNLLMNNNDNNEIEDIEDLDNDENKENVNKNKNKENVIINQYKYKGVTDPIQLCEVFQINSCNVFDGEMMKKRFSRDYLYKESFIWINPSSRSIHWSKDEKRNPAASKYIEIDNSYVSGFEKAEGESRGVLKSIEICASFGILIKTESKDYLELSLSPDNFADWVKVFKEMVKKDFIDHNISTKMIH